MTIGMYLLRASELGLSIIELENYTTGELLDMITERHNDSEEYPIIATGKDILKMTEGGHGFRVN